MVLLNENVVGIDSAIFMHPTVWKASGHVDAFNDPLIDNKDSKKRYRADVLIEDLLAKIEEKINKEIEKAGNGLANPSTKSNFVKPIPCISQPGKMERIASTFLKSIE